MAQPRVLVGAPIKNRAWVLPEYLNALEKLDYHPSKIDFCFIINDCLDATENLLMDFKSRVEERGQKVELKKFDFFNDEWLRLPYVVHHLILMRNKLIEEALKGDYEYLFLVDSDVILYPKALKELIRNDKDIVGGFTFNIEVPFKKPARGYKGNIMVKNLRDGTVNDYTNFPLNSLFEVDAIGSVRLISRAVLEEGIRYDNHIRGEDAAFCLEAKRKGFGVWCDSRVFCRHKVTEFSVESMETVCYAVDLKNALLKQKAGFKRILELAEKFSDIIEEEQYQLVDQLDTERAKILGEIRSIEASIVKEQWREKLNSFFAEPKKDLSYTEILPLLLGQIGLLDREIGELGERLTELDLQNRLLVQKKQMLRELE